MFTYSIPFIAIRYVTDTSEHSGIDTLEENCAKASAIARDITAALLTEIGITGQRVTETGCTADKYNKRPDREQRK